MLCFWPYLKNKIKKKKIHSNAFGPGGMTLSGLNCSHAIRCFNGSARGTRVGGERSEPQRHRDRQEEKVTLVGVKHPGV